MKVLLVEDTDAVREALAKVLRAQGWRVGTAASGMAAVAAVGDEVDPPDLVLLDLGLPDLDGIEVCRRIRGRSTVPIIAVTARGHDSARVMGLRSGADDYVVKPFSIDELLARVEAVMRRSVGHALVSTITAGPLEIDLGARSVHVDGTEVALRRKEFDLLAALARREGRVATREELLDDVWGLAPDDHGADAGRRTLEVHVAALRSRLGVPGVVVTVRGVGYRLGNP
ncbi:response regulator transcription factor [Actinomycetospora sp. OC33-EN08]|uniref:Sensory transduction protein RegX3 n=1 Tax=Actinomycetospora aurantiaca TaxID=3129233 RepID=A0ABU8MJR0_9PSEU